MARKKQKSRLLGWVLLGLVALGVFQSGIFELGEKGRPKGSSGNAAQSVAATKPPAPLSAPRFVNVASLNVRHTPSPSGELIIALPRGTALRVLERQNGWLLVDLNPTLEGWVAEHLTTTQVPQQRYMPPAPVPASR
ncbi:SH3 domain-containing protein [Devosia albogilva]|uniref:SH3 domain-containing protein n=1 Tax=Devosia albogilva TaxID=429726 RepID=A0ABW5QFU1_9HYPH